MHSFTDTTGLLLETLWSQTIKLNHTVSNSKLQRYKNNYVPYIYLTVFSGLITMSLKNTSI